MAPTSRFARFAGNCAVGAGVAGFLYAVAFVVLQNAFLSALFLLLGGLLSTAAMVAVYERLRTTEASFALWAMLLGVLGTAGAAVHGGYDLANAINPTAAANPDLPSQIDPRGLLTFGVTGAATLTIAWLMGQGDQFPQRLGYLGYVLAVLLLILYVGRLVILSPANPAILVPAVLNGFVVNPAWYIWLGLSLRAVAAEPPGR